MMLIRFMLPNRYFCEKRPSPPQRFLLRSDLSSIDTHKAPVHLLAPVPALVSTGFPRPAGGSTYIHQAKTRCGILSIRPPRRTHRTSCATWIHKELPLQLVRLELMRSPPQQHIYIHMPSRDEQAVRIPGRNDGVSMRKADPQRSVRDNLGQG